MSNNTTSNGLGFYDGLLLLLIGYRLAGIIDWPWWQVIGIPVGVAFGVAIVLAIIGGLTKLVDD